MKRLALIPAVIFGALALPGVASAHTPHVTPSCTGLSVALTNYEGAADNNVISVQITGPGSQSSFMTAQFGSSYTNAFVWSQDSDHGWTVTIDANVHSGNPTQYDRTFTGTWEACQPAPTTTTTTVPPTTTVPATTVPPTTTTTVAVALAVDLPPIPPVAAPAVVVAPPAPMDAPLVLPVTGSWSQMGLGVAMALVGGGALIAWIARRRVR